MLRIISLNTWGGRAGKTELLSFLTTHAGTTDIFCLQEVWSETNEHLEDHITPDGGHRIMVYGREQITTALPNHEAYYRPNHLDKFGLLLLVNKKHTVTAEGEVAIYQHKKGDLFDGDVGNHVRAMQYATIKTKSGSVTVMHVHGLWNGRGKMDCPERIEQSEKIVQFTKSFRHPFVLAGDLCLLPDTASIKMIEDAGIRNLIKKYNILSTRTSFYSMPDKFSDYVFVSKDITVTNFSVLPDEVSDHSPLLLEMRY